MVTVLEEFELQARFCREFGSPFTSELLQRCAESIATGGIVARLTQGWPGHPRTDAVSLRLAGALHAAALSGRDPRLTAAYPAHDRVWSMEQVWPVAQALLETQESWVREFMTSPPQTNETARAMGLASGFLWLAETSPEPFHMLELGASAGLNLNWDRFAYAYPPWRRERLDGPFIPTVVDGAPPRWREVAIASRRACDQNPLDAADPGDRLRLRAYIWADQIDRMRRLNAALDLARAMGLKPEKADAGDWIRRRLAGPLPAGTSVVYHSVFYQYPPLAVREAIRDAIEAAGSGTSADRRLAWVRFEPESVIGGEKGSVRYVLNIVTWRSGQRSEATLADVDPHGRSMVWRG